MRYHVLACDYDGTIALHGAVDEPTIDALTRLRESGRKVVLVTGRELDDLMRVFPRLDLFDRVVAENGALLYRPSTREERLLAQAPPPEFARELSARGAARVSVGKAIVATWEPYETVALETIRDFGLELQVIFNKGAVMVLPSGVNKATGLNAALSELGISRHNVVGVGDAENDHAFLGICECSVAVSNALDSLKERVDWITPSGHGQGVIELIQLLLKTDLSELEHRLKHVVNLGKGSDGSDVAIKSYGANVLVAGTSGSGKSTLATSFLEGLCELQYQFVVIDPEGDYSTFEGAVVLGDEKSAPSVNEVMDLISASEQSAIVNMIGVDMDERPGFFETLLLRLCELRAKTGRPHWIIIDEGHHVLPSGWEAAGLTLPMKFCCLMIITLEPDRISPELLSQIDAVIAIGDKPEETIKTFTKAVGDRAPKVKRVTLGPGEAIAWLRRAGESPFWFQTIAPKSQRRRHRRKYAEGNLAPELCFYFKGPERKLNLKVQNLAMFLQVADGVDDETWIYHLMQGDFSVWFRDVIKDPELAAEADRIRESALSPEESRGRIRAEIERRYILAA